MGLFGFLASDKPSYSDKVWMTRAGALRGMMTEALKALTQTEAPVILSWFSDRQQEVLDFAKAHGVPHTVIDSNLATDVHDSVLLLDAQWSGSSSQAMDFLLQQSKATPVTLLFYGHYPIPGKESELLNKIATAMNRKKQITFFSSLDDRAFEMFGADNIKSIMEKMGLKEDEPVEHAMVTKAMARAREKIAGGVSQEITAPTETTWYQKNYAK